MTSGPASALLDSWVIFGLTIYKAFQRILFFADSEAIPRVDSFLGLRRPPCGFDRLRLGGDSGCGKLKRR